MRPRCIAVFVVVLLAGALLPALAQELPPVLAKVGGQNITKEEVLKQAAAQLEQVRQQQYDILKRVLDGLIDEKIIDAAATKEGKGRDAWLNDQIEKKVTQPSDAEIETAYNQNKPRLGGQTLDQARPGLINMIKNQQRNRVYSDLMTDLRAKASVSILLEPPRSQVAAGDSPFRGPKTAPVTIIAFSDYQCPFCSRAEGTIKQVQDVYGDKVRVVFRNFPLSFHRNAQGAAEAAACAGEQGKFWEMHDLMFAHQDKLAIDDLKANAKQLGLDSGKFDACLDTHKKADQVGRDQQDGQNAGVSGTPAFFVNGRLVSGARPFDDFSKVIDEELTRAGLPIPPKPAPKPPTPPPPPAAPPAPAPAQPAPKAPEPAKK